MPIIPSENRTQLSDKPGDDKILDEIRVKNDANHAALVKPVYDADKKTKQIQAQGCIQAAVQAQSLLTFATNEQEWYDAVQRTADKMIKYIQERS